MYFLLGGAGKTTLLNALSNRAPYAKLTGEVTFGQREFNPQDLMYVPQFDDFNHNMTVYETLQFIGEMKCANKDEMFHRLGVLMKICFYKITEKNLVFKR
jgi:ABC-type multidrug transport system ATPase subunit